MTKTGGDDLNDDLLIDEDYLSAQGSDDDDNNVRQILEGEEDNLVADDDVEESIQVATGKKRSREGDLVEKKKKKKSKPKSNGNASSSSQVQDICKSSSDAQFDFLCDQLKSAYPRLSQLEIQDKVLPSTCIESTQAYNQDRIKENLPDFVRTCFPSTAEVLSKNSRVNGSPRLLIVCPSAIRCVDVVRSLKSLNPSKEFPIAKLFAKHIKLHEQEKFLKEHQTAIAVATPQRAQKLIESDALNLKYLSLVILDGSTIDSKQRTMFEIPEIKIQLFDLLCMDVIRDRFKGQKGAEGNQGRKSAICLY